MAPPAKPSTQMTMWFRFILFVSLLVISHSQRVFDGVTLVDGDEVHIDFWKYQWHRLHAHETNAYGMVYYRTIGTNAPKRDDHYTWIFEEQGSSARFQSVKYPGFYLGLSSIAMPNPTYFFGIFNTNNLDRDWLPKEVNGNTFLQSTGGGGCLYGVDSGTNLQTDQACTPTNSVKVRIVPRFPCYQSSYFNWIMGWYSGLSVDLSKGQWQDMTGRGYYALQTDTNLNDVSLEVATQDSTGLPYLKGSVNDSIVFQTKVPFQVYTAIFLTRYRDTNQANIIECKQSDCAVGHRDGLVGVLYQDGSFLTSMASFSNPQTYLISTVQLGYYRANGYDIPTAGTPTHTNNDQFCINCGSGASGDFEVYEVIIVQNIELTTSDIQCIEDYLTVRYNVALQSKSPTPAPTQPTQAPTGAPSKPTISPTTPTLTPTEPSNSPSNAPSSAPSVAPSLSPTACVDLGEYNSNDGLNQLDVNELSNSTDFAFDTHPSTVVNIIEIASNAGSDIYLNASALELQCHGVVSCFQTRIFCSSDQATCNVLCDEYLSCSQAVIYANHTQHVHIICDSQEACSSTAVYANMSNQVTIDCVASTSCQGMSIHLDRNDYNLISCYLPNACDDIRVHTSDYNDTKLRMFSYSNNVILDNGYGLRKEDTEKTKQIECNTDNQYIRYHSNLTSTQIETRMLNEYNDAVFPCDGVQILCEQNTTDAVESHCTIDYNIRSITPPMPNPQCYWVSITDLLHIHCPGTCLNSPTKTPTKAPSFAPTEPTVIPTNAPSSTPTSTPSAAPTQPPSLAPSVTPTLAPSLAPSQPPTLVPSLAPTLTPSLTPTSTPTAAPSLAPTLNPSLAPTLAPTLTPTWTPSIAPTLTPTLTPSLTPTLAPSIAPSIHPTLTPTHAPSLTPTKTPTMTPTVAPTVSPSAAPTRTPTTEIDLPYWIDIIYELRDYTETNLHFIVNDSVGFVEAMQEICEMHYFPAVSTYNGFVVQIMNVNGVSVVREDDEADRRRMKQNDEDEEDLTPTIELEIEIDDLYSFQLQQPIQLISQIFAEDENIAGSIITRSKAHAFAKGVQKDIRDYFDNDAITFNIDDVDALEALDAIPPPPAKTDWTVIVLSIIVVTGGFIASIGAFVANKRENSSVDNAAFLAPLLVALQIYDLISDVNLGFAILGKDEVVATVTNPYFLCGLGILFFTVLPFVSNLYYAMTLPQQKVIRQNTAASTYFKNRLTEFVLIVVFTGGCYPALALVSSRIFGLDVFNCGLTKYELNKLSKIKIRSTITLENGPQLVLQIIYVTYVDGVDGAMIMAFTASLLSVIATLAAFYAQSSSDKSENNTVVQYALYLCFKDHSQILLDDESKSLRYRKERKAQLSRSICSLFQFPQESIEVGYIKIVSDGCVMNMVHYVFEEQLNKYQKAQLKMNSLHQGMRGLNLQIEPLYYVQHLCMDHHDQLTTVMCNHFHLNNAKRFMVKFVNDDMEQDYFNDSQQQMLRFGQTNTAMDMGRLAPLSHHQLLSSSYSNLKGNNIQKDNANDEQKANVAEVELMAIAHPQQTSDKRPPGNSSLAKIQSILAMQSQKMAGIQKQTVLQMGLLQEETQLQISSIVQLLETDEGDPLGDNHDQDDYQGAKQGLTLIHDQGATNEEVGE
eukprot:624447_1